MGELLFIKPDKEYINVDNITSIKVMDCTSKIMVTIYTRYADYKMPLEDLRYYTLQDIKLNNKVTNSENSNNINNQEVKFV